MAHRRSQHGSDNCNADDHVTNYSLPPSLSYSTPYSQLSTINVSCGKDRMKYPMDLHFLVAFLALMRNLQHLCLRDMISSSPIHCRQCQLAHLPRLRSLRLRDTARRLVSLVDHITIPPDAVLDLDIVDRGNSDVVFDILVLVGDILNGNNADTPQTFDALSIHPTPKGLVIKGFINEPELSKLRALDSPALYVDNFKSPRLFSKDAIHRGQGTKRSAVPSVDVVSKVHTCIGSAALGRN
ncbi:hypothetical protein QCA50_008145 [Cerrena zonata]|uniref:Uncharacterized protein n=1 Tax=Cerrena zonata TaxID=2478898 RepID=A0AAW0GAM6_9APHY